MSASLFNPIHAFPHELPRMRANFVGRAARGVQKVRRALFPGVDHVETEKFLQQELAKHARAECERWEFDFSKEMPFNFNNNKGRFAWKPVTPSKITLAPRKRQLDDAEEVDNSELYATLPDKPEVMHVDAVVHEERPLGTVIVGDDGRKRQSKITDFMQSRKRSADLAFAKKKKTMPSPSPIPTKRTAQSS